MSTNSLYFNTLRGIQKRMRGWMQFLMWKEAWKSSPGSLFGFYNIFKTQFCSKPNFKRNHLSNHWKCVLHEQKKFWAFKSFELSNEHLCPKSNTSSIYIFWHDQLPYCIRYKLHYITWYLKSKYYKKWEKIISFWHNN